jgi:hypothetical protein
MSESYVTSTPTIQFQFLESDQVASLLGIKPKTLRNWRLVGHGPTPTRLSRNRVVYLPADLDAFFQGQREPLVPGNGRA